MKKFLKRLGLVVLAAVLIHIFTMTQLHTECWQVTSDRLPAAFDGFRITLLTDIHGMSFGRESKKLLQAVEASEPDLIAISGDIVDRWSSDRVLQPLLTGLVQIAPTCYVTGNHEWDRDDTEQIIETIEGCGVQTLRNEWYTLEKDGQTIVIAGAEDPNGYADQMQPDELMAEIRAESAVDDPYVVMLYHRNNAIDLWADLQADLVLAGHGHGGVIRLPGIGGLLGVDRKFFPKDCEGLYTKGRTTLAVSRGLGGVRLWNRPHIPTIELKSVNIS